MKRKFFKNKGFTLFELLAVLAILSIIAAIAVPRVMQTIKNARIEALKNNMQLIANSVQRYVTEEELTGCIGGMFVIHPSVEEETANSDTDAIIRWIESSGTWNVSNDSPTDDDVYHITIEASDGHNTVEIADNYIEGGIPAHIRVIVRADSEGKGHIEVSYGNVDDGSGEPLLLNGITAAELGDSTINKTFELDSGVGHDHKTEGIS